MAKSYVISDNKQNNPLGVPGYVKVWDRASMRLGRVTHLSEAERFSLADIRIVQVLNKLSKGVKDMSRFEIVEVANE